MDSLILIYRVVIADNTAVGLLIVALIAILAGLGGWQAVAHLRRYRITETNALNQTITALRDARKAQGSDEDDAKRLAAPVDAEELAAQVPIGSIIAERLKIIAQLRRSKVKVGLEALQQISRAHEAARVTLRAPGFAANLCMLIGLLGTFVGIAMVIQQIGLNIRLNDGSLESFGKAFGGMYTKFSTTLVGLASAIVLGVLNFRLALAQEAYFDQLERFTVEELLPATVPTLADETVLEKLNNQLNESLSLIHEISTEQVKTAERVGAIQDGFATIVQEIRRQIHSDGPEQVHSLMGQMASVIEQVGQTNISTRRLVEELPKAIQAAAPSGDRGGQEPSGQSGDPNGIYVWVAGALAVLVILMLIAMLANR